MIIIIVIIPSFEAKQASKQGKAVNYTTQCHQQHIDNVRSPGIVNQTPRSIRSYIGDIFTPNPTFLLTLLTRKSWFTS